MINHLQNYSVGKRLAVGFGILVVAMAVLAAVALSGMRAIDARMTSIVEVYSHKAKLVNDMIDASNAVALSIRGIVIYPDPQSIEAERQALMAGRAAYDQAREELYAFPADEKAQALRARLDAARAETLMQNEKILAFGLANDYESAAQTMSTNAGAATTAWASVLVEQLKLQEEGTAAAYAEANAKSDSAQFMLLSISALALLLAIGSGVLLSLSLTRPIGEALRVANDVAAGRLDGRIAATGRDELAKLLGAMQRMQQQVKSVIAAQVEMATRHDEGQISFRMDDAAFPGEYGQLARETNALVAAHIAVKMRVVEVMKRYAIGDLSVDMDRLPGEKATITESMDATKASLAGINAEIKRLAAAAVAGDFSVRGDVDAYQYDFRDMVVGINRLMQVTDQSLAETSTLLKAIAQGDLTARMEGEFEGVFARIRDDANATAVQLADIVGQIRQGSDAISAAAGEIAAGNNDLSQRTEQQAASLEETASSMEELTSTVRQTADNARQASQLALGAADVASQGGAVVGKVVDTMTAINASSRRIVDIISVIDGIAFQTNILALNAAVEAARAGEQGRGFAVVASEVRSLAQRSAGAAKEIKQLIDDSVETVDAGTRLVDEAGKTMSEIVSSVKRVTDIIADISAAAQEQSSGIEQINQAVLQMDEGTQQNAALVEEASAAARSLEQQSGQLVQTVSAFRLDTDAGVDRAVAAIGRAAPTVSGKAAPAHAASARTAAAERPKVALVQPGNARGDQHWQEF